jgi:excisionase family DNA binding protein
MMAAGKGAAPMNKDTNAILERRTCSVEEFGKMMGVSKNPAYEAVKRGDVASIRVGGRIRIPTAPLKAKLGIAQ